jgi:hypothetical protein
MQGRREVDPNSGEWSMVDYQIQMITGKSSLKVLTVYSYNSDTTA